MDEKQALNLRKMFLAMSKDIRVVIIKLVDRGINVLRIGNPTRVNDKMLGFTYE